MMCASIPKTAPIFQPLRRDDTVNGETYYRASDVDAVIGGESASALESMQAAFEAKYQRDWDDPASEDMKAIWVDAWAAAMAVLSGRPTEVRG